MTTSTETKKLQTRPGSAATCRCGQDLDLCTREHCPRCGVTLPHVAHHALAA